MINQVEIYGNLVDVEKVEGSYRGTITFNNPLRHNEMLEDEARRNPAKLAVLIPTRLKRLMEHHGAGGVMECLLRGAIGIRHRIVQGARRKSIPEPVLHVSEIFPSARYVFNATQPLIYSASDQTKDKEEQHV